VEVADGLGGRISRILRSWGHGELCEIHGEVLELPLSGDDPARDAMMSSCMFVNHGCGLGMNPNTRFSVGQDVIAI
jgi:hypothetical protein